MKGRVTAQLEAILQVAVRRSDTADAQSVIAVIDTGFTDELVLSRQTIDDLRLTLSGETMVGLGDGSVSTMKVFEVEIFWNDRWKRIKTYEDEEDALVGMALLRGNRLIMDVASGGEVAIQPLGSI